MSVFADIPQAAPDVAFSLVAAYKEDPSDRKVDLCPGFYRDENAEPWILPCVRKAKDIIHADPDLDHEHLPLLGHPGLLAGGRKMAFGPPSPADDHARIASIQTVSGTGSNHLGARFLASSVLSGPGQTRSVWLPHPTWVNHPEIWALDAPAVAQRAYPYYDRERRALDRDGLLRTLARDARKGDVVVLHACAHNPTGLDPGRELWVEIGRICQERGLFVLFDSA
ncbi:hypothetical protein TruAng_011584 [Truncatella angustata]|nr:hypothetical protein TruAng_011584 [Truncatella angustata]